MEAPGGFHIISLGCPKNRVDSERFQWILRRAGLEPVDEPEGAELILLNTCAFIEPAIEESLEHIHQLIQWRSEVPGRKLVVAGCLPGRYSDDGSGGLEDIDLILGPEDWRGLARWLRMAVPGRALVSGHGPYRYLKIAEGCSNGCSYCTIPSIRGGFRAVDALDILRESDLLVEQGAMELGLVAQDSGRWSSRGMNLFDLAGKLADRHSDRWIRMYYLHPAHVPPGLEKLLSSHRNVVPYIDMPIQHASSRILARMGRGYDEKHLRTLMERIEALNVETAVRLTVITGYPGETREDFDVLRGFLGDYPSIRHIAGFIWYPEEGTLEHRRTIERSDGIDYGTASSRLAEISAVGEAAYGVWDARLQDREITVLADDGLTGHTVWDAPEVDGVVAFTDEVTPGAMVRVRVVDSSGAVLMAEPVSG